MKRKHCEVTDPIEIQSILAATTIGRIATTGADGYPYITPVNFVFHEGNIYFHCGPIGEKLDNIARDPRVCFQVDVPLAYLDAGFDPERNACNAHQLYHCVIIRGEARVVPNGPLKVAALNALAAKHEPELSFEPITAETRAHKLCAVVEVKPGSVTAKSELLRNRTPEQRLAVAKHLNKRNRPGDRETIEAMGFDPEAM